MATFGKLEGRITVPSGGWDITIEDSIDGGPDTANIAAGIYYMSTLITALETAIQNESSGNNWTVTIADGEAGTGKVTIATSSGGNIILLWPNTDLRDILGWASVPASAPSVTSPASARMIWQPDGHKVTPFGDSDDGFSDSDGRATESPSGHTHVIQGARNQWLSLEWRGVSRARTRIAGETVANQSFEKFWQDCIQGEGPGATPGGPVRLYWDAADNNTYATYAVVGNQLRSFSASQLSEGWIEQWIIPFERLVKVPA